MKKAIDFGKDMNEKEIKAPAPKLSLIEILDLAKDAVLHEVQFYQVGKRSIKKVFVLVRKGYATIYVQPNYAAYRSAYKIVFSDDSLLARDVDHLAPRNSAMDGEYIALGNLDQSINRSHQDDDRTLSLIMKAMNETMVAKDGCSPLSAQICSRPRPRELGMFVINGYIQPFTKQHKSALVTVTPEQLCSTLQKK
jgi:hypothetical protein